METKRITLESDPAALRALLRGIAKQAPLGNRTLARIAHAAGGRYKACPHCGAPVSFIVGGRRDWAQCATWDRGAPESGRCAGGAHIAMRALRTVDVRGIPDAPDVNACTDWRAAWPAEYCAAADAEGWNLFDDGRDVATPPRIERDDEAGIFPSDDDAAAHVAAGTMPWHVQARAILARFAD